MSVGADIHVRIRSMRIDAPASADSDRLAASIAAGIARSAGRAQPAAGATTTADSIGEAIAGHLRQMTVASKGGPHG